MAITFSLKTDPVKTPELLSRRYLVDHIVRVLSSVSHLSQEFPDPGKETRAVGRRECFLKNLTL